LLPEYLHGFYRLFYRFTDILMRHIRSSIGHCSVRSKDKSLHSKEHDDGEIADSSTNKGKDELNTTTDEDDNDESSDVPGLAWAQSLGLGWALVDLGLPDPKPDPELRLWLGLGLVGLEPGLHPKMVTLKL
jgi:hypothetical protein